MNISKSQLSSEQPSIKKTETARKDLRNHSHKEGNTITQVGGNDLTIQSSTVPLGGATHKLGNNTAEVLPQE